VYQKTSPLGVTHQPRARNHNSATTTGKMGLLRLSGCDGPKQRIGYSDAPAASNAAPYGGVDVGAPADRLGSIAQGRGRVAFPSARHRRARRSVVCRLQRAQMTVYGYAETREAAMAAFAKSWRRE
jgi:hypothetical protein